MRPLRGQSLKRKFAQVLDLPQTTVLGQATVSLTGNFEAVVQNHKGLIQYNSACIKAGSLGGTIEINGRSLQIVCFSSSEIKISGQIYQVVLK